MDRGHPPAIGCLLLPGIFEPLPAQVNCVTFRCRRPDQVRDRFGEYPKTFFALPERFLRELLFRYILEHADRESNFTRRVDDRRSAATTDPELAGIYPVYVQ